jgi:hypothetical protein
MPTHPLGASTHSVVAEADEAQHATPTVAAAREILRLMPQKTGN